MTVGVVAPDRPDTVESIRQLDPDLLPDSASTCRHCPPESGGRIREGECNWWFEVSAVNIHAVYPHQSDTSDNRFDADSMYPVLDTSDNQNHADSMYPLPDTPDNRFDADSMHPLPDASDTEWVTGRCLWKGMACLPPPCCYYPSVSPQYRQERTAAGSPRMTVLLLPWLPSTCPEIQSKQSDWRTLCHYRCQGKGMA